MLLNFTEALIPSFKLKVQLRYLKIHIFTYFSKYGFVFGIAQLGALISSFFVGWYGLMVGIKRLSYISFLIGASSAIAFAFVIYANNTAVFLGLSYLIR